MFSMNNLFETYLKRCDELTPNTALQILTELYMRFCGESLGYRSVVYFAADYWMKEAEINDVFCNLMPQLSEEYRLRREEFDSYDVAYIDDETTYTMALDLLKMLPDSMSRIALCAGVHYDINRNTI